MKITRILFLLLLNYISFCKGQAYSHQTSFMFNEPSCYTKYIRTDSVGNIYFCGMVSNICDIDPGPGVYMIGNSLNQTDIFVAKYTKNLQLIWAYQLGGIFNESPSSFEIDHNGYLYITGSMDSPYIDFNPFSGQYILPKSGSATSFLVKYDLNFNIKHGFTIAASIFCNIFACKIDKQSNIYLGGRFHGNLIDFDPGANTFSITTTGYFDSYLAKYDSSGGFIHAAQIGGTKDEMILDFALDDSANIYSIGTFSSKDVDFNPSPSATYTVAAKGPWDSFIAKYSKDLDFKLMYTFGDTGSTAYVSTTFRKIKRIRDNLHITGGIGKKNNVDFDVSTSNYYIPNLDTASGSGVYLTYDLNFNLKNAFGLSYKIGQYDTDMDSLGNFYVCGSFLSMGLDFDPGPGNYILNSNFGHDMFLAKYSNSGSFNWAFNIGTNKVSTNNVGADLVFLDDSLNILIIGATENDSIDLDPSINNAIHVSNKPYGKMFFARYKQQSFTGINNFNEELNNYIQVLPNPAFNNIYISIKDEDELLFFNTLSQNISTLRCYRNKVNLFDISNLASGLYYLKSEKTGIIKKIIKQ